ncbi:uncharacterized protein LOC132388155 isoform X2 [Hypanus sabinus]|nr:uncharacterized protein LOC132388155 isoform X2 [Hypanus sabinus]
MGCSKTKCTGGQWKFDSNLVDKWYRFSSSGAWKIPETAVCGHRCSGKKPGWLNGPHPNVGEGEVTRTVCFTVGEDTCHWKQEIRVKNCTRYFVYQLKPTPCCKYVYCTVIDSALSDPCETYIDLDQPWRSTNCSHTQCSDGQWMDDGNLEVGWYRFNSSGGRKIPETVVHGHRCSGENPGWLNGSHPSVGEQEVHRSVCFSSGENTCSWSLEIKVKNCPGYFVYWLKPTPANHTVYCTAADSAPGDLCVTHTILDQPWRSTICNNTECTSGEWMGDGNLTVGWYRFNSSSGQKIPEMTVRGHRCSGKKPGWLNGPHPGLGEGEVTRTVCFTDGDDTCDQSQEIRVKNCSGYFVYRLWPTPEADAVYCMTAESTLGDPCVTHTVLDQPWRSTNCSNTEHTDGQWKGDENLEVGWYRFNSSGGWKIPETVVPQGHCSGDYSGWLNGPHPSVGEGEVTRTVCFTEGEDPCSWDQQIRVKNCTGYFVYRLWPTREADAVYCTDTAYCDPCVTHTVLDQPCRSTSCCSTSCTGGQWMDDGNLEVGWYRFNSSGGWKIPEMVVPPYHCSGEYPGWLNGSHPNVGEGEVTRTVCFTVGENTCYQRREIRVKNCSGYFVYRLWPTPSDNTVYCTDSGTSTGEQSEGSPTRDFSPAGDTTTGPGTSTGKQSGRSSTGDFSQETSSVPARDTASDPPNSKGSSRKPSSGPEKETCSVKGLLSKNECEEMINSAQVFIIGKNKLGNPEEREVYIRQVREMLMEQLPCKHVLSKSEHDNGGGN